MTAMDFVEELVHLVLYSLFMCVQHLFYCTCFEEWLTICIFFMAPPDGLHNVIWEEDSQVGNWRVRSIHILDNSHYLRIIRLNLKLRGWGDEVLESALILVVKVLWKMKAVICKILFQTPFHVRIVIWISQELLSKESHNLLDVLSSLSLIIYFRSSNFIPFLFGLFCLYNLECISTY